MANSRINGQLGPPDVVKPEPAGRSLPHVLALLDRYDLPYVLPHLQFLGFYPSLCNFHMCRIDVISNIASVWSKGGYRRRTAPTRF